MNNQQQYNDYPLNETNRQNQLERNMKNQLQNKSPMDRHQIIIEPPLLGTTDETLYAKARLQFIRKVYLILGLQLLITAAMCFASYYSNSFYNFQNQYYWISYIGLAVIILTCILIFCLPAGRKHPWNLIFLFVFTICQAYFVSFLCAAVGRQSGGTTVVGAAVSTLAIVVGLSLYAIFARVDFRILFGIIVVVIFALIPFMFIAIFTYIPIVNNIILLICVILCGVYLVYDTTLVVGGNGWVQLSMDDYVIGALVLYIDIIRIFLYILALFGGRK